jgi:hypothetical protein
MKHVCAECGLRRDRCIRFQRTPEYAFEYICPACWKQWDYAPFFYLKGKGGALDGQ